MAKYYTFNVGSIVRFYVGELKINNILLTIKKKIKPMKMFYLIIASFILMTACGPAPNIEKIPVSTVDTALTVTNTTTISNGYYQSSDWNLPKGVIVGFTPENEAVQYAKEHNESIEIYIHIKQDNGAIIVKEIDYKTWLNLPQGAVIN